MPDQQRREMNKERPSSHNLGHSVLAQRRSPSDFSRTHRRETGAEATSLVVEGTRPQDNDSVEHGEGHLSTSEAEYSFFSAATMSCSETPVTASEAATGMIELSEADSRAVPVPDSSRKALYEPSPWAGAIELMDGYLKGPSPMQRAKSCSCIENSSDQSTWREHACSPSVAFREAVAIPLLSLETDALSSVTDGGFKSQSDSATSLSYGIGTTRSSSIAKVTSGTREPSPFIRGISSIGPITLPSDQIEGTDPMLRLARTASWAIGVSKTAEKIRGIDDASSPNLCKPAFLAEDVTPGAIPSISHPAAVQEGKVLKTKIASNLQQGSKHRSFESLEDFDDEHPHGSLIRERRLKALCWLGLENFPGEKFSTPKLDEATRSGSIIETKWVLHSLAGLGMRRHSSAWLQKYFCVLPFVPKRLNSCKKSASESNHRNSCKLAKWPDVVHLNGRQQDDTSNTQDRSVWDRARSMRVEVHAKGHTPARGRSFFRELERSHDSCGSSSRSSSLSVVLEGVALPPKRRTRGKRIKARNGVHRQLQVSSHNGKDAAYVRPDQGRCDLTEWNASLEAVPPWEKKAIAKFLAQGGTHFNLKLGDGDNQDSRIHDHEQFAGSAGERSHDTDASTEVIRSASRVPCAGLDVSTGLTTRTMATNRNTSVLSEVTGPAPINHELWHKETAETLRHPWRQSLDSTDHGQFFQKQSSHDTAGCAGKAENVWCSNVPTASSNYTRNGAPSWNMSVDIQLSTNPNASILFKPNTEANGKMRVKQRQAHTGTRQPSMIERVSCHPRTSPPAWDDDEIRRHRELLRIEAALRLEKEANQRSCRQRDRKTKREASELSPMMPVLDRSATGCDTQGSSRHLESCIELGPPGVLKAQVELLQGLKNDLTRKHLLEVSAANSVRINWMSQQHDYLSSLRKNEKHSVVPSHGYAKAGSHTFLSGPSSRWTASSRVESKHGGSHGTSVPAGQSTWMAYPVVIPPESFGESHQQVSFGEWSSHEHARPILETEGGTLALDFGVSLPPTISRASLESPSPFSTENPTVRKSAQMVREGALPFKGPLAMQRGFRRGTKYLPKVHRPGMPEAQESTSFQRTRCQEGAASRDRIQDGQSTERLPILRDRAGEAEKIHKGGRGCRGGRKVKGGQEKSSK